MTRRASTACCRGSATTCTGQSGHASGRCDHAVRGRPIAEKFPASLSGAPIRIVTGTGQASHARSTSGGISATPARTIRETPAGSCSPSASKRLRLFMPHASSLRSTRSSNEASAAHRSASTLSRSFLAAVASSSPFSCNERRSPTISRASPPAQFFPSPGGAGNNAS